MSDNTKRNEITEIPRLPEMMDLTGCTVTVDAIGTQVRIMDALVEGGADFCLQLKRNHRDAFEAADLYFRDQLARLASGRPHSEMSAHVERDKGHGRIGERTYWVATDPDDVRLVLPGEWRHVVAIGMAERRSTDVGTGEVTVDRHFHVLSRRMSAREYAGYARGHWGIESNHWLLDIYLGEDRCTAREGNSIPNWALLRKIALNLARLSPEERGKTSKKREVDFILHPELFTKLIFEDLPRSRG